MRTIVIYKSETGFTKKYAYWIAQELRADIYEVKNVTVELMKNYDTIVYGGGLYAIGISGVKLITSNLEKLAGKKVIVFTTGASPGRSEDIEHILKNNFTLEELNQLKFFYLRGGFDYSKLRTLSKMLMLLLKYKIMLKKIFRSKLTPDEKGMLFVYDKPTDFTNRKYIMELIEYAKS